MNKTTSQLLLVMALIFATALMRIVNAELHLYNLVPIAALGVFSGSVLRTHRAAYIIPLASLLISDIGLALFTNTQGFYGISQFVNYGALILVTFMGSFLRKPGFLSITGITLGASAVFFILSNLGTFLQGYYGYSFNGLVQCYVMAIPFYKSELATNFFINSFAGDLCFSWLAFGICYLASLKMSTVKAG